MFALVPEFQREDLYEEFLRERRTYRFFNVFLWVFGYGCFATYLVLLWGFTIRDPVLFLLDVVGLVSRISAILLHKIYEVPRIFQYLFSENLALQNWSYNTIDKYRNPILGCLLENLYGKNADPSLLLMDFRELKHFLISYNFVSWRKFGRYYFAFYVVFTSALLGIVVQHFKET